MQPSTTIMTAKVGNIVGRHAVVVVGYGERKRWHFFSSIKYWEIQNSWGATWGTAGYIKVERGKNLYNIESECASFRAWVDGYKTPPCFPEDNGNCPWQAAADAPAATP